MVAKANSTDNATDYTTYLTLESFKVNATGQEAAEITYTEFNISYASFRVKGRVRGSPGAVAGIFTYYNDTTETDIEMFTRDPTTNIEYSNAPTDSGDPDYIPVPGAHVNDTLPNGSVWTDWHVHRFDWIPGRTTFFFDDILTNTTTTKRPVSCPRQQVLS